MKRLIVGAAMFGAAMSMSARTEAAVLTLTDTFGGTNTVWTLTIQDNCTTCAVTLQAVFQDPAGAAVNAYTGTFIDSVQWVVSDPNIDPTAHGFNGTNAGAVSDWSFALDQNLSANQCGGGAQDAVCGEWISGGTAGGFGPIVNGSTLFWTFNTTFSSQLTTAVSGNIRAAFNTSTGTNFNIFSPGGGSFGGGGGGVGGGGGGVGGGGGGVPEPAALLLFGLAAVGGASRLRRRQTA